jgi:hypothetical protein
VLFIYCVAAGAYASSPSFRAGRLLEMPRLCLHGLQNEQKGHKSETCNPFKHLGGESGIRTPDLRIMIPSL